MILPLDREAIPKQQQKDFTWEIPKGKSRNDGQMVWDKLCK